MKMTGFREDLEPGHPELVLKEYLEKWAERDWKAMVELAQISWVGAMPDPEEMIKAMYGFKPIEAVLIKWAMLSDVAYAAIVNLNYTIARGVATEAQFDARVICEKGYLVPSPDGTWGVNPTSITPFIPMEKVQKDEGSPV